MKGSFLNVAVFACLIHMGWCVSGTAFESPPSKSNEICLFGSHFNSCGSVCPLTCSNYQNPPENCGQACESGCECDEGLVRYFDLGEGPAFCVDRETCQTLFSLQYASDEYRKK